MRVRSRNDPGTRAAVRAAWRATAVVVLVTLPVYFATAVSLAGGAAYEAGVRLPEGWMRPYLTLFFAGLVIGAFVLPMVAAALAWATWRRGSLRPYAPAWLLLVAALVLFWLTNRDVAWGWGTA